MFTNLTVKEDKLQAVLKKMSESILQFTLTGSRFAGTNKEHSDWDFFTEENGLTISQLRQLGFSCIYKENVGSNVSMYGDVASSFVYRHPVGIDVQVIKTEYFAAKKFANEFLLKQNTSLLRNASKFKSKEIWTKTIQASYNCGIR